MRRLACLGVFAVVPWAAWWGAVPLHAEPLTIRSVPVPLNSQDAAQRTVGRLRYLGGLHLTSDDKRMGGWSCLRLGPDGTRLTAISDEGMWMTARIVYDRAGVLAGLEDAEIGPLLGLDGKPLEGKDERDSESCALLPDGSLVVGFERQHRLWHYPATGGRPDGIPLAMEGPLQLAAAPFNGGIESLVALSKGRLLAVTEYAIHDELISAWTLGQAGWQDIGYRFERALRPSDACVMPGGDVVFLERAYSPDRGIVGVRLRQVSKAVLKPGARLGGRLVADLVPPVTMDNFEGLDCRKGRHGTPLFYVISDDNFNPGQRTLLLLFALNAR